MLTVCPKCALTLAVTAADLRVGQGYVRCGRCATVFNALLALTDASTLELPGSAPPRAPAPDPAPATATPPPQAPAPASSSADPPADPAGTPAAAPKSSSGATATVTVLRNAPEPVRGESRVRAEDDVDEVTIDPSLAAAPLDLVLEQTSDVAPPGGGSAAPEFVLPAADAGAVEEIDIDLGTPVFEDEGYERTDDNGQRAAMARLASNAASLEATGTVRSIVMEGTSVLQSEEFVDIDTIDSEIANATRRALEAEARKSIAELDHDAPHTATGTHRATASHGTTASSETGTSRVRPVIEGASQPAAHPEGTGSVVLAAEPVETRLSESGSHRMLERNPLLAPRTPPPKPPPSLLLWSTFSAALVLILGAQAVHFWRNDIALRNDWIGHSLTKIYAVLGVPLTPNWDLRGYDVRQLGAATNGSGDSAIRVRIRLTNRATRAQPFPVLRLSLYDRYGKKVAARDLQPRDYLPRDKANGMMPVSQQFDSEVAVLDPGPNASSFELDVCTPGARGLRCASDSPLRPAQRP